VLVTLYLDIIDAATGLGGPGGSGGGGGRVVLFYVAQSGTTPPVQIESAGGPGGEIRYDYDYGYVHPDTDQDYADKRLSAAGYASAYQDAWSGLPTVMNYRQRYLDYFASRGDFTRDVYVRSITDPAVLTEFKQRRTLDVTVDLTNPKFSGRAEAKVEVVAVALIRAQSPNGFIDCTIEHGGTSTQRKANGNVVTQYLRPHHTVVQSRLQPLAPSDLNPDPRTDPLTAPRTIAFWGRGVATTWRLTIDDLNVNLSALSEIQFGIDYVAFRA
jgi:hypothetical protein